MKRTKFHKIQVGSRVVFESHLGVQKGVVREIIGTGKNRLVYVKFNKYELSAVQEIDLKL